MGTSGHLPPVPLTSLQQIRKISAKKAEGVRKGLKDIN